MNDDDGDGKSKSSRPYSLEHRAESSLLEAGEVIQYFIRES